MVTSRFISVAFVFVFFLLELPLIAVCQDYRDYYEDDHGIDDLKGHLTALPDSLKAGILVKIAYQYYQKMDYPEAISWIGQAEQANRQRGDALLDYYIYHLRASIFYGNGAIDSAISCWYRALTEAKASGSIVAEETCLFELARHDWKFNRNALPSLELFKGIRDKIYYAENCVRRITYLYYLGQIFGQARLFKEEMEANQTAYDQLLTCYRPPAFSHHFLFTLLLNPGRYHHIHGNFREALRFYRIALEDLDLIGAGKSAKKDVQSRIFNAIARTYLEWGKYDSSLLYEMKAIEMQQEIPEGSEEKGIIDLSNYLEGLGYAYLSLEQYDSAIRYFQVSKRIRISIKDELGIAMSDDGLGETSLTLGNYFISLEYLDSSLIRKTRYLEQWLESIKNKNVSQSRTRETIASIAHTKRITGKLYRDWEKYELAVDFFEGSLEDAMEAADAFEEVLATKELGVTYARIGDMKKARIFLERSLSLSDSMDIPVQKARTFNELGQLALREGREDEFIILSGKADDLFIKDGLQKDHAEVLKEQAKYWLGRGELEASRSMFSDALEIADRSGLKRLAMECCYGLEEIYTRMDSVRLALTYMKRYHRFSMEIFDLELLKKINQVDAVNQLRKKEEELENLALAKQLQDLKMEQNRYILVSVGALMIILVLFFALMTRNNRMKAQQKLIRLEQRLLRSQMNPHFIFNALTNIQDSIFKNDPIKTSKYLTHFSRLIRNILLSTREELVPLQIEIDLIRDYLELQKLRHSDKFDFEIKVDKAIDPDLIKVPPMLAQPFIENAVEHGIRHKIGQGKIEVRFTLENSGIHFMVEDDGIGREAASRIRPATDKLHRSMASQITIERLEGIRRGSRKAFPLQITDLIDETGKPSGTKVEFEVPLP